MQLPKIKRFIQNTLKSTIFAFTIITSLTGCALKFGNSNVSPNTPASISENVISTIAVTIDETDWKDEASATLAGQKIKDQAESIVDNNKNFDSFQKATIVKVVDGDTLVVEINGEDAKVRLIGIDTPESVASEEYLEKTGKENTKEGKDASDFTKMVLENVDYVYLEKDTSDTDPYGRFLRYVWLDIPSDECDLNVIASEMLNGILLKEHIAVPVKYEPDTKHADDFEEIYNMEID